MHRFLRTPACRTHLIFGANTDVGKTVISAGLVHASLRATSGDSEIRSSSGGESTSVVHYIKPLQCGGSDEIFVQKHVSALWKDNRTIANKLHCQTLMDWETFASPHVASRKENVPKSDEEVLSVLHAALSDIVSAAATPSSTTWIETAGGVLSPSSSSPDNQSPYHAHAVKDNSNNDNSHWGWLPQGDLYKPLANVAPVVLIGDGRLGGK